MARVTKLATSEPDAGTVSICELYRRSIENFAKLIEPLATGCVDEQLGPRSVDWFDQYNSPLAKKTFMKLVREGTLPARKAGKRHLVDRPDMKRLIETFPSSKLRTTEPPVEDPAKREVDRWRAENARTAAGAKRKVAKPAR